jgi:cyanate lyase
VWVAGVFYGQAKPLKEDLTKLAEVLGLTDTVRSLHLLRFLNFSDLSPVQDLTPTLGDHFYPERGQLTPMPPTDPVLYRLYEIILFVLFLPFLPFPRRPRRNLPLPFTPSSFHYLFPTSSVYGYPLKAVLHEKFGDGIMSAINFNAHVEKVEKDGDTFVKLSFLGKWLPYSRW